MTGKRRERLIQEQCVVKGGSLFRMQDISLFICSLTYLSYYVSLTERWGRRSSIEKIIDGGNHKRRQLTQCTNGKGKTTLFSKTKRKKMNCGPVNKCVAKKGRIEGEHTLWSHLSLQSRIRSLKVVPRSSLSAFVLLWHYFLKDFLKMP